MKQFKKWFGFMMAIFVMILSGGSSYAMAETPPNIPEGEGGGGPTGPTDGPGIGGTGPKWQGGSQEQQEKMNNWDYYVAHVNPTVVEMKLESCPIDQILRASKRMTPVDSNRIEYYSIGQRPIKTKLAAKLSKTTNGGSVKLTVENATVFGTGDIIMIKSCLGYQDNGTDRSTMIPLQLRVTEVDNDGNPTCYALNGKKNASRGNRDIPEDIEAGTVVMRLGRAAGEKEVETCS